MNRTSLVGFFLASLVLFTTSTTARQSARVQGQVMLSNHRPAVSYVVKVDGKWSYTDTRGVYVVDGVPYGKQHITITKRGTIQGHDVVEVHEPVVNHDIAL